MNNLLRVKIFFILFSHLFAYFVKALPQTLSVWKNGEASGKVVILHDNHGCCMKFPHLSNDNFNYFKKVIRKAEEENKNLHVLIECSLAAEHGDFMGKFTRMNGTDCLLLSKYNSFFSTKNKFKNISFYNLEFRNLMHVISIWLRLNGLHANKEINPSILSLITEAYDICEKVSFKDLYSSQLDKLNEYIQVSNAPCKDIFEDIYRQTLNRILPIKHRFEQNGMKEEEHITSFFYTSKASFVANFLLSESYQHLLKEMIEAHALYLLTNIPTEGTKIVILGYEHAKALEKYVQKLGYVCSSKISCDPEKFPISSYDKFLMPPHGCDSCLAEKATHRCSQCKTTRYCSVTCQKKDWPEHKKICTVLL